MTKKIEEMSYEEIVAVFCKENLYTLTRLLDERIWFDGVTPNGKITGGSASAQQVYLAVRDYLSSPYTCPDCEGKRSKEKSGTIRTCMRCGHDYVGIKGASKSLQFGGG